jgi:hypothetical protein
MRGKIKIDFISWKTFNVFFEGCENVIYQKVLELLHWEISLKNHTL